MVRRTNSMIENRKCSTPRACLRSEKGSALVLVMFIVLLLTILGVAVLSATIGGAQRTETRENDVQSLHLAGKGLNEATAYIQAQLEGLTDIDPDKLEDVLAGLDKQGLDVTTELGANSSGTIEEIKYSGKQTANVNQQTREYYINVTASAMVNGVKRTLKQQIIIDSYPEFLKYAFGSDQILTLNGAPLLEGNIYAGDKLIVTNTAEYRYKGKSDLQKRTQFPKVKESTSSGSSVVGLEIGTGEVHVQSLDSIRYSEDGRTEERVGLNADVEGTLEKILGVQTSKIKIKERKKFVQINVEESFFEKMAEAFHSSTVTAATIRNEYNNDRLGDWLQSPASEALIKTLSQRSPPIKPEQQLTETTESYMLRLTQYNTLLESYNHTFMNLSDSVIVEGNLLIDGLDYHGISYTDGAKSGTTSLPKWFIVNGDLVINNTKSSFLPISGNILVRGNVTIKGNVAFDSTMLVLGEKTTVEDAVIKGLGAIGDTRELVLISKGSVLINRINAFTNEAPSEMDAFFYTDSSAELYGVGSIFWLKGGFFAKGNLTLNAALGDVSEPSSSGLPLIFTEPQQQGLRERFKVTYNNEVYSHQQSSLPRVRKVNISVGPLELVSSNP